MTSDSSLSPASVNVRALKPAIVGKHIDASTPLTFMSRTRSCTSKQPGRSSVNEPGLNPHSSRGQPTVAAMPNGVDVPSPWKTHSSMPCALRTTFGAWSSHLAGTWFLYMSGGSIDVVVDADQDHVVHGLLSMPRFPTTVPTFGAVARAAGVRFRNGHATVPQRARWEA